MNIHIIKKQAVALFVVALPFFFGCSGSTTSTSSNPTNEGDTQGQGVDQPNLDPAALAGAGFTTSNPDIDGSDPDHCLNGPGIVNCNLYDGKEFVWINGGPDHPGPAALDDGTYFFAVLEPSGQNNPNDGGEHNLSDVDPTGGVNIADCGDPYTDRMFTVSNGDIDNNLGTHDDFLSDNQGLLIRLFCYDTTSNPGGVYILALCQIGNDYDPETNPVKPSDCKYDAFKAPPPGPNQPPPTPFENDVRGRKYYDTNANGQLDDGEEGIADWLIDIFDDEGNFVTTLTTLDGVPDPDDLGRYIIPNEVLELVDFTICERQADSPWLQTGNVVDQTIVIGDASVLLREDMCYEVHIEDGMISGTHFGNICLGPGGGHTLGYWSNKNGHETMNDDGGIGSELNLLSGLNLVDAGGSDFDPSNFEEFRDWILGANAVNMAYMLSAQLAAMELNVEAGFVDGDSSVFAPGCGNKGSGDDFISIDDLMDDANTSLGNDGFTPSDDPNRDTQECLKNALDDANNNLNFVQPSKDDCPAPVFPDLL